ncbi:MAG: CocE/NonD family hydrolase, partial [Myxococcota bacterium]
MRRVISILVQLAVAGVLLGTLVTAVLFAGRLTVLRWELDLPAYTHEIGEYRDTWMETRDGVRLSTQVILPEGEGPFPTIVLRSPYNVFRAVTIFCEVFA